MLQSEFLFLRKKTPMSLLVEIDSEAELRLLETDGVIRSLQERVSFAEKKLDEVTVVTSAAIAKSKEKTKRAGQMQGELRLLLKDTLKVLSEDRHPAAIALRERIQTALDK